MFIVSIKIQTMPCLRQHIAETGFKVLQTMEQLNPRKLKLQIVRT